jgi:hypothetical protein
MQYAAVNEGITFERTIAIAIDPIALKTSRQFIKATRVASISSMTVNESGL